MSKIFTITTGLENMGALKTGGQGSVYKGRRVGEIITAIKLLPTPIYSETAEDKNFTRFQNEVQKLKKVNEEPDPNVVKILSSGITETGNFPFIEMEFIEGPDLEDLLKPPHDPVFTIKEALKVADQLSNALAHCHRVNVKHGDIKSNNVKFNLHTGNYVLLDFGLAIMSDEERRTSLRHAGAIEFMAPEQNEGKMFFETDVYSFGVIMFELLAGIVPFPLKDKGETSRNAVMLAHMETPPPNLFTLRGKALPEKWSDHKKESEMQVPEWMFTMIYRCLEKKPEARFASGMALHEFISQNSIWTAAKTDKGEHVKLLQQENKRLLLQNQELQEELSQYRKSYPKEAANISAKKNITSSIESPKQEARKQTAISKKRWFLGKTLFWIVLGLFVVVVFVFAIVNGTNKPPANKAQNPVILKQDTAVALNEQQQNALNIELENAKQLLRENKKEEALNIYARLVQQNVPQAMFQYGNLALQNKNDKISCSKAFDLLIQASDKDYLPAKTALGFLYSFAKDAALMKKYNYYTRCVLPENIYKGAHLLMEAAIEGDATAAYWLDQLNAKQHQPQ
jgi:serine/threonine-protein kinase